MARHSNFARVKYQAIVFKAIKNVRWAINLDKKTAVVTAGAGFIGSNLCQELAERGKHVVILDDLSTGKQKGKYRPVSKG